MSVAYELKRKRAELVERLQQIATEQIEIQGLMGALDRVILSYEPTSRRQHLGALAASVLERSSRRHPR